MPALEYEMLDLVRYNGGSYLCRSKCRGVEPNNDNYWTQLSRAHTYEELAPEQKADLEKDATEQIAAIRQTIGELIAGGDADAAVLAKIADIYGQLTALEQKQEDMKLAIQDCDRVLRMTEAEFEAAMAQVELERRLYPQRTPAFIEKYLGWSIDVMEDSYTTSDDTWTFGQSFPIRFS